MMIKHTPLAFFHYNLPKHVCHGIWQKTNEQIVEHFSLCKISFTTCKFFWIHYLLEIQHMLVTKSLGIAGKHFVQFLFFYASYAKDIELYANLTIQLVSKCPLSLKSIAKVSSKPVHLLENSYKHWQTRSVTAAYKKLICVSDKESQSPAWKHWASRQLS